MENTQTYWSKNTKVEIWNETHNGNTDYWKKENGVSYPLTCRQYKNIIKKFNLKKENKIILTKTYLMSLIKECVNEQANKTKLIKIKVHGFVILKGLEDNKIYYLKPVNHAKHGEMYWVYTNPKKLFKPVTGHLKSDIDLWTKPNGVQNNYIEVLSKLNEQYSDKTQMNDINATKSGNFYGSYITAF